MERNAIRNLIFTALFASLMVMGTYIRIPIGPVPVVLTNFFIFLTGLFLGPWWGLASVGLYLAMGALGLPVFSSGGGIALFAGPTGGFLVGYLPAVFLTGLSTLRKKKSLLPAALLTVAGAFVVYSAGVPWLKYKLQKTWLQALSIGCFPFLIFDGVKVAASVLLWHVLLPVWDREKNTSV